MIRSFLIRYALPTAAAVFLVAIVGVPYIDRVLTGWFRSDVQLRATVIMNSLEEPLAEFLDRGDTSGATLYLSKVANDERLLGIKVCAADSQRVLITPTFPKSIRCSSTVSDGVVRTSTGQVELSSFPLPTANGAGLRVLLAHDLAFIDRRRTAARNLAFATILVAAVVLAMLVGLGVRLLFNRWLRLLLGDISNLRFFDNAQSPVEARPALRRVRQLLDEVEARQRLEIEFRENWTPQALQQVAREMLGASPLLVVSNREPYVHNLRAGGGLEVQVPASGMVTAIEPVMRACSGTWIAHGSGSADRQVVDLDDRVRVPPGDPTYTLRRVWLSSEEEEGYYYGFSNEGLWPLCHLAYVRPAFRESDWAQYVAVNEKFAAVVAAESTGQDPVILIQDFHFALLPKLIRQRTPRATIALFWHIPWPNAETFGVCPWKRELLLHMLGADILGFHTLHHCQNFLATLDRYIECHVNHELMTVTLQNHVCRVRAYPISIEWPPRWLATTPAPADARRLLQQRHDIGADVRIGIGVERWDFTKGIIERFHALEYLFESNPGWIGRLTFLQVAAPSRSKLPAYQALQEQTLAEARRINARWSRTGWQPIVLVSEHQEPQQVFTLYRAADFCLVNSLHDGMNLVAKEFVAARDDEDGVLILSTFAGASRELVEALLVNPYDVRETATAMIAALEMSRDQRRKRMQLMRRTVAESNVHRWAGRMLIDVSRIRQGQQLATWMAAKRE